MKPKQQSHSLSISNNSSQLKSTQQKKNQKQFNRHSSIKNSDILSNKKIVSPQKLKILVLSGNDLQNDQLQFLSKCINLIKLDLSHNHITKIYQRFGIHKINNLRTLYLQANKLSTIDSVQALFGMKNLNIINYHDNPIEQNIKAEHLIINNFPNLKVINHRIIFLEERDFSLAIQRKNQFIAKDFDDWVPAEHSQKYYLKVLKLQLEYIDNMWMFHNPIIKIQRVWKAILEQEEAKRQVVLSKNSSGLGNKISTKIGSRLNNIRQKTPSQPKRQSPQIILVTQAFKNWKQYSRNLKQVKKQMKCTQYYSQQQLKVINMQDRLYLTYQINDYYLAKRNLKLKSTLEAFLARIRYKLYVRKLANIFRRNVQMKIFAFADPATSFLVLSGLRETKKLYFNRIQQHLIENFLAHISKNFNKSAQIYRNGKFGIANNYCAVRLMDPDTYASKTNYNPLTYLIWPSMRAVILKKKKFPYKLKSSIVKLKALSYIKNRDKKLTPQQIKKSQKTYGRIDRFFQHQYYQGLGYFQCKDEFVLQHLIRMIFYHNTRALSFQKIIQRSQMMSLLQNYKQSVSIYTDKLLQRTTAAVKIQQQWRRYVNNKKQQQSIYQKLKKNRASRLIQRFLRDRVFYHRLSFQRNLSLELSLFDDKDLIIPQNIYKKLPQIITQSEKYLQLYKELRIIIGDKIQLYHQDFNQKQIFFPSLRKIHLDSQKYSSPNGNLQTGLIDSKVDIHLFLHKNAHIKIIQCKGQKFYQFIYKTIGQVKLRAACMALMTYRLYGSVYMLPLSKSTLYMYNDRIKIYKKYAVHCRQFQMTQQESNFNKLKFNLLSDISLNTKCSFIYLDPVYQSVLNKNVDNTLMIKKLSLEFYQKRFQDFPEKYQNVLKIVNYQNFQTHQQKREDQRYQSVKKFFIHQSQIGLQKAQKQSLTKIQLLSIRNMQQNHNNYGSFISAKPQKNRANSSTKVNILTPSIQVFQRNAILTNKQIQQKIGQTINHKNNSFALRNNSTSQNKTKYQKQKLKYDFSIKKTLQKRFSLYQLDTPAQYYGKEQQENMKNKTQDLQKLLYEQIGDKREKVLKFLEGEKQKKSFFKQKKEGDLTLVRQKRRQQRLMNNTLKSFNQQQRTQELRKKAQKIRQYKRRSLSNKKVDQEAEFMQQGNFIIEQHLKMNIMRNKLKDVQKLKQKRKSLSYHTDNLPLNNHQKSQQSRSKQSNYSKRNKKQIVFDTKDVDLIDLGRINVVPSANLQKHSHQIIDQIFGGQTEIINKKSYVKKRSSKTGAYIRDPSFVHGVFPQQYYPIQSSRGGIIFPRV